MAYTKDYVPGRDADFDAWYKNLKNYVYSKVNGQSPAWTHIPAARTLELVNSYAAWNDLYQKTLEPHTRVDTLAKNEGRAAAEKVVRSFVQQYLMFPPVTNEDREAMGLHNPDPTRTNIGTPDTRALITDMQNLGGFRVKIRFQDETTPLSHAIPYGMNGCLLIYICGEEKVSDYKLLTSDVLMTASPFTLELPAEAEGKFLSVAAMWQNDKGEKGPKSDIMHIAVS
jgi:hypothetical protein